MESPGVPSVWERRITGWGGLEWLGRGVQGVPGVKEKESGKGRNGGPVRDKEKRGLGPGRGGMTGKSGAGGYWLRIRAQHHDLGNEEHVFVLAQFSV